MLSLLGRKLACAPVAALRVGGTPTLLSASRFAAKKPSFVRFGGSDHGPRTDGITHAGLTLYPPKKAHVIEAKLWGALAWFWIFYQLEANWDVMLGFRAPWEHRGDVSLMEDDELPDGTTPGGHKHHH